MSVPLSIDVIRQMHLFRPVSILRKLALQMLVKTLENDKTAYLRKQFEMIDEDHSGLIDSKEIKKAVKQAKLKLDD